MSSKQLFRLQSEFKPCGDQPQAISRLVRGVKNGFTDQVLLGVTGSGKTFTMAHLIQETQRPALILAPNKTLAAQLFHEFREFFPYNAVEYFISYYDYYQPEAYNVQKDSYIAKSSVVNDDIDKMRHSATRSLVERRDVIVVASVSCIYGLGRPEHYLENRVSIETNSGITSQALRQIFQAQFYSIRANLSRGSFTMNGSSLFLQPSWEASRGYEFDFQKGQLNAIFFKDLETGEVLKKMNQVFIYPASHYLGRDEDVASIQEEIQMDLEKEVHRFRNQGKFLEAKRLEARVQADLEQIKELGYCQGIENYSRYFDRRQKGEPPATLLDYFPEDFLVFLDESHIMVPQISGMYQGDRKRKENLVKFGFRLEAALDNRPLHFQEFQAKVGQSIYISATPGDFELKQTQEQIVEQVIRPTGLLDPVLSIKPAQNQIEDLIQEVAYSLHHENRVIITTLTKKTAEHLSTYLSELGYRSKYLHCDVKAIERSNLIRDFRLGLFDVLIGINLLREGLDIPEVDLVAILDADKEGFLRSKRSLMQTVGRAARHEKGRAILYADKITKSIQACLDETERRRQKQIDFNEKHQFKPQSILKPIPDTLEKIYKLSSDQRPDLWQNLLEEFGRDFLKEHQKVQSTLSHLKNRLSSAVDDLEFEEASLIRDQMTLLNNYLLKEKKRQGTAQERA